MFGGSEAFRNLVVRGARFSGARAKKENLAAKRTCRRSLLISSSPTVRVLA